MRGIDEEAGFNAGDSNGVSPLNIRLMAGAVPFVPPVTDGADEGNDFRRFIERGGFNLNCSMSFDGEEFRVELHGMAASPARIWRFLSVMGQLPSSSG